MSPPNTRNNSPLMPVQSSSGSNFQILHPPQFVKPRDRNDPLDCSVAEVERQEDDDVKLELSLSEFEEVLP
jgi:hypothetical protein